jgi:hypothetical protein
MSTVLNSFETWKHFLGDRVDAAKKMGLGEESISKLAFEIGDFLSNKVDPKNEEQRILKELWDVGDDSDRQTMARLMVKLADRS